MWNKIKLPIFVILIPLVLNIDFLYEDVEANDGTDNKKVIISALLSGIRIYTKIETSSKINVDIISDKPLNKSQFYCDRATKVGGSITKKDQPTCTNQGKTYYCMYSVKKEDDYEYGVLILTDFTKGDFLDEIIISVRVITETAFWVYAVIIILVLLVLIIGAFMVCRYCYRCVCCKR